MVVVSIDEIRRDLGGFLDRVHAGEPLVITDDNRPIAELRPLESPATGGRPQGLCAGEFEVPDRFDDPLPDDILRGFTG
jgi:prevent-host-death family protein